MLPLFRWIVNLKKKNRKRSIRLANQGISNKREKKEKRKIEIRKQQTSTCFSRIKLLKIEQFYEF